MGWTDSISNRKYKFYGENSTISKYDVRIVLSVKLIYFGERFPDLSRGDIGQTEI